MIKFPPTVMRSERNEFVLRLAVKVAVAGHLCFAIVWPLVSGEPEAKILLVSRLLGKDFIAITAALIAATVLAAQWVRPLRIAGGIAYMAFCWTYAALVGEPRLALFSMCMSLCGLGLAWTGVPDDD
jgi:hypothetical protein